MKNASRSSMSSGRTYPTILYQFTTISVMYVQRSNQNLLFHFSLGVRTWLEPVERCFWILSIPLISQGE
eukprot:scaffold1420_cov120-Skeletonema_dohrnii-CCMP3373.AAC.3